MQKQAFNPAVPKEWLTTRQQIKEKTKDVDPESLVKERVEQMGDKVKTKNLKQPNLFLRDLKKVMTHVDSLKNPKGHGLSQKLVKVYNNVSEKIRENPELTAEDQNSILESAQVLQDGELLTMLSNLFSETYKRASLVELIRKMARIISQASGAK